MGRLSENYIEQRQQKCNYIINFEKSLSKIYTYKNTRGANFSYFKEKHSF